jgi:DNA-binding CsgD family transcriptional regulator
VGSGDDAVTPSDDVREGTVVVLRYGDRLVPGVVIEDRGPLGVGGGHVFRIRLNAESLDAADFELSTDRLLTPREIAVLRAFTEGEPVREIALELKVSPNTVDQLLTRIRKKLGVESDEEATTLAERNTPALAD